MNTNAKFLGSAAVVGMLACAGAAPGDTIQAQFQNVSPSKSVKYSLDSGESFSRTSSGNFNWTRTGGDYSGPGATGDFVSYCIELTQYISGGHTYDFEVRDLSASPQPGEGMGALRANRLRELWGRFHNEDFDRNDAAAFQVAVWEVTHDDDLSISTGNLQFKDKGRWFDTAQDWLDTLDGTGPSANLLVMSSDQRQDHVFEVPNPASAALLALGGICGASARRRRDRQAH